MKQLILLFFCCGILLSARSQTQTLAQIKKELETTTNPVGYVKYKLKKKFFIDSVTVFSTTSFMGKADSLAYNGKIGKVYGPFKKDNILVKVLAKVPNTFYHVTHILLDTSVYTKRFAQNFADTIINRIKRNETTFAAMAKLYSIDIESANRGGDLGWFVRGVMLPQLDAQLNKHKKGDIFTVWTSAGLHIVTITDAPKQDNGYALLLRVIL
jgi:parvulin-like peptidyl-prolyl isomerase